MCIFIDCFVIEFITCLFPHQNLIRWIPEVHQPEPRIFCDEVKDGDQPPVST